jgi:hypothetical protein
LAPILNNTSEPTGGTSSAGSGGAGSIDGGIAPPSDSGEPDAGKPEPDSGLDPDIKFDWTQTLPGQELCGPSRYAGSFTCSSGAGSPFTTVFGQLTFELADDDIGEGDGVLRIADGLLSDLTGGVIVNFEGPLTGSLECKGFELIAEVLEGVLTTPIGLEVPFTATLKGLYDPNAFQFAGTISMINGSTQEDCSGAFEAGLVP